MARRNKSTDTATASAAMPTDTEYTELSYEAPDADFDPDDQEAIDIAETLASAPAKPRLIWNSAMDDALTLAVKQTRSGPDVVRLLQSHEAFENFPASIITQGKIGGRLSKLRKAGVNVPKLKAGNGGGFQGQVYVPNVERLNRLLEGEDAAPVAPPAE